MGWIIWITWWIIFCIRYSRLFWVYLKKTWRKEKIDNPSVRIYVNKIENRITSKTITGYYLELSSPETMKLLEISKSKITKDENGENVPHLKITEVVLIHCDVLTVYTIVLVVYTFVPNKSFGQLLDISHKNFIFLKTFNSEFSYIEVWFTEQKCRPLEMEDKINITLVIIK